MRKWLWLCCCFSACGGHTAHLASTHRPAGQASPRLIEQHGPAYAAHDAAMAAPLQALLSELQRFGPRFSQLKAPRPYFLAYRLNEHRDWTFIATLGSLLRQEHTHRRFVDVDVRVGDHHFDNTHFLTASRSPVIWTLPVDDNVQTLRPTIWWATERAYHHALSAYLKGRATLATHTARDDHSDDFSHEQPVRHVEPLASLNIDARRWEDKVRRYSAWFRAYPHLLDSRVVFSAQLKNRYLANLEGSVGQTSQIFLRLTVTAFARTTDGMNLVHEQSFDFDAPEHAPDDATVRLAVTKVAQDLQLLSAAPLAEPMVAPALLEGPAAAVLFHEVFGHRIEGHRQKRDEEGQTFSKKIGQTIMPTFVDIYDDPTLRTINAVRLNGYYRIDDEGVAAQRTQLVEHGVLRTFLLGRTPVAAFPHSNGHGRAEAGHRAVARQGNLVVQPHRVVPAATLRQALLAEVKRQAKPYGLRIALVAGGLTTTARQNPQAFSVAPVLVYRVYPDGHEELIRGAVLEGTPLTALSQILAAGDDMSVFNGYCGAESGSVPVSAAAPSLLLARLELTRSTHQRAKLPILPAPPAGPQGTPLGGLP